MDMPKVRSAGGSGVSADVHVSSDVLKETYAKVAKRTEKAMSEKMVKERVRKILKDNGIWFCTPIGSGFGAIAHDFICCVPTPYGGMFLSIETKAAKGRLTPRQMDTTRKITACGGHVALVYPKDLKDFATYVRRMMDGDFPPVGA